MTCEDRYGSVQVGQEIRVSHTRPKCGQRPGCDIGSREEITWARPAEHTIGWHSAFERTEGPWHGRDRASGRVACDLRHGRAAIRLPYAVVQECAGMPKLAARRMVMHNDSCRGAPASRHDEAP